MKKVLGQVAPAANTDEDVYTVPSGKQTVVSSIVIANRGTGAGAYSLAVRPAGATIADEHYLAGGITVSANSSDVWTIGITLEAGDVVTVEATTADFSFSLFGDES